MFRTARRFVNPLVWAVIGFGIDALSNQIFLDLSHLWHRPWLVHGDELVMGMFFGAARFLWGEYQFAQVYATHQTEHRVNNALQVLLSSTDEAAKANAARTVSQAFEQDRTFHRGWRE